MEHASQNPEGGKSIWAIVAIIIIIVLGILSFLLMNKMNEKAASKTGNNNQIQEKIQPQDTASSETNTSMETSKKTDFTMDEVKLHNSTTDCYAAVNGSVYDLTGFVNKHPGGSEKIENLCGQDGTSAFTNKHGGQMQPEKTLESFKIGVLKF